MAFIQVNHKTLRDVADAADKYCESQDREMKTAKIAVSQMLGGWKAADSVEFDRKWKYIDEEGSVTKGMNDSVKSFGNALRSSAEEYRKAQEDSYNEACRLPKW